MFISKFKIRMIMIACLFIGLLLGILLIGCFEIALISAIPEGSIGSININFNETIFAHEISKNMNDTIDYQITKYKTRKSNLSD